MLPLREMPSESQISHDSELTQSPSFQHNSRKAQFSFAASRSFYCAAAAENRTRMRREAHKVSEHLAVQMAER